MKIVAFVCIVISSLQLHPGFCFNPSNRDHVIAPVALLLIMASALVCSSVQPLIINTVPTVSKSLEFSVYVS